MQILIHNWNFSIKNATMHYSLYIKYIVTSANQGYKTCFFEI